MMNKSNLFKNAHKAAKEIKAANVELTYRDCFAVALKEAYKAQDSDFIEMASWFAGKNGFEGRAFHKDQIVGETEKALKIRTAKIWGNGLQIVKECWVPKSVCTPCTALDFVDSQGETRTKLPFAWRWIVENMNEDCFEFSKKYCKSMAREFC